MKVVPGSVNLEDLRKIFVNDLPVKLCSSSKPAIDRTAALVKQSSSKPTAIYGINTGFGKLATKKISFQDIEKLQKNLILSHCSGVGPAISEKMVRFIMVLKLLSLGRGASGVRWEVCQLLEDMLQKRVAPVIPAQGSVGASGDLAPLAHMSAVMIGEGKALFKGKLLPARKALSLAGLLV